MFSADYSWFKVYVTTKRNRPSIEKILSIIKVMKAAFSVIYQVD